MRTSLVICLALFVVMVNCAAPKPNTTSKRQSAYAYLRSVRSKNSCASGTCAFWERHGRSFAALRCYSQQYKECVCLHRMCFSSCMFSRQECNQEMVSCLKQICPRCMPASSSAMCQVYDSMAEQVANALSVFACYPCCPNLANSPSNNTSNAATNMMITTTPAQSSNNGNTPASGNDNAPVAGSTNSISGNTNKPSNNSGQNTGNTARPNSGNTARPNTGNTVRPNTGNNARPNTGNNARPNNTNGNTSNFGGVFPGSGMTTNNGNVRNNSSSNNNANNRPVQNQQVRSVTRPVTQRTVTTRRKTVTTPRPKTTTRGNNNKNAVRKPVQAQKKPQF